MPDEKWGERPKAFVVLKPGAQAGEQELIDHVRSIIARYKAPKAVDFLDELPQDLDRQGPEVRAPRARVGRAGVPDQGLSTSRSPG